MRNAVLLSGRLIGQIAAVLLSHGVAHAQGNDVSGEHRLKLDGEPTLGVFYKPGSHASAGARSPEAEEAFPLRIDGDVGLGVYYTRSIIRGRIDPAVVLPYAYFDFGRLFARIDTVGVKVLKMGYGYLEFAGRVELDGFKTSTPALLGINERKNSLPIGIGTLQETPLGAVFINALYDFNSSAGKLYDITYIGKLGSKSVTVYPQAGLEYLSKQYVRYYYGVSVQEAATSRFVHYRPGGALNPFVATMTEVSLSEDWNLNVFIRRKWLGGTIANSPIVGRKSMDTAFIALAYRFK